MRDLLEQVRGNIRRRPLSHLLASISLATGVAAYLCLGGLMDAIMGPFEWRAARRAFASRPTVVWREEAPDVASARGRAPSAINMAELKRQVSATLGREVTALEGYTVPLKSGRRALLQGKVVAVSGRGAAGELRLAKGRWISDEDDRAGAAVCMLSGPLAELAFDGGDAVGGAIRLAGRPFRVVGVFGSILSTGPLWDSNDIFAVVPLAAVEGPFAAHRSGGGHLVVESTGPRLSADMADVARAVTGGRRSGPRGGVSSPWLDPQEDRRISNAQRVRLALLSLATLVVGLMSVVGMLLASVRARAFEIGVRRALGATRTRVMLEVAVEGGAIGLCGGILGLLLGLPVIQLCQHWGVNLRPSPFWYEAGLIASVITSVLASAAPARAGAEISPVEALRSL